MASNLKIPRPGRYVTAGDYLALVDAVIGERAYGSIPGLYEKTWWHADTGLHPVCRRDDIITFVGE